MLLLQSTNGTDYAIVFSAQRPLTASFSVDLYAREARYSVDIPNVTVSEPFAPAFQGDGFRSAAIDLRRPAGGTPIAARIRTHVDGLDCPDSGTGYGGPRFPGPEGRGELDEADLEAAIATEVSNRRTRVVSFSPKPYSCPDPFHDARMTRFVQPLYSGASTHMGTAGSVFVKVALDQNGKVPTENGVPATYVYKSSGNADFDKAARAAAAASTYEPETFACSPMPSTYIYRAYFSR
jgi:hypothetical protein